MRIRVVTASGGRLNPRHDVVRCIGVVLAALPLFAGYVLILFDGKRRGFHDRLAGTLVIEAPQQSALATRQASRRAEYLNSKQRPPALFAVKDRCCAPSAERTSLLVLRNADQYLSAGLRAGSTDANALRWGVASP
jgi:hypothetical protein